MSQPVPFQRFNLILEQHAASVKDALTLLSNPPPKRAALALAAQSTGELLLIGTGSSYHLNRAVAPLYRQQGIQTHATPTTELLSSPLQNWRGAIFITSLSGTSNEIRQYLKQPSGQAARHFGLTLNPESDLSFHMPTLIAPGGLESGLVPTRGFLLGLLLHFLVLQELGLNLDGLQETLGDSAEESDPVEVKTIMEAPVVFFVGDGLMQGIAEYAAVFLMELTRKPCFAFSVDQYRESYFAQASHSTTVHLHSDRLLRSATDFEGELQLSATPPLLLIAQVMQVQRLLLAVAQECVRRDSGGNT